MPERFGAADHPTLSILLRYVSSEAWAFAPTAINAGELRDMVSNPLDPDLMTASERLAEVASLLARGILRYRFKAADGRKKPLDVLAEPSDECVETRSEVETHE